MRGYGLLLVGVGASTWAGALVGAMGLAHMRFLAAFALANLAVVGVMLVLTIANLARLR